ncbi:hypothetical protein QWY99_08280 [Flavobacterium branchiarum]|uniref:DUF4142 domain-containing protein n=1 Tax=Flavobacterium branchiarum TaxID=1114870 RepID=A0ABV5FRJ6_9FLAO|nr:hypothetical protein [Flavobacterium branchiarum]MDN3673042.1 hypothetical protein [Flavobacterium branchiarum]
MRTNFYIIMRMCILLLLINSCSNKCIVKNIEVSVLLSTVANEKSINYCELLRKALTGDENSIKKISLLEFDNAVGYDHGAVIVDLVTTLGETEYIKAISKINSEQKKIIHSYIDVGLEYGNNSLVKGKNFKSAFPNLYFFLKE